MATPSDARSPSLFNQPGMAGMRRMNAFEPRPEIDALIRKLIADVETAGSTMEIANRNGRIGVPDPAYLRQVSSTIAQDTTDATSLMQLLPDISLVEQLLISSILAPKDLINNEVTFKVDRRAFHLPIAGMLLEKITDYFTNIYDLKKWCTEMLSDALFKTGSYPLMIVPENSVDDLINGQRAFSMESYHASISPLMEGAHYRPLHLLGNGLQVKRPEKGAAKSTVTIESLDEPMGAMESLAHLSAPARAYDPYVGVLGEYANTVLVTDNFNVLKAPAINEAKRHAQIAQALRAQANVGLETGNANYSLGGQQRRTALGRSAIVQAIKTKEMLVRPTVGHPLTMHLPSESVIPVFITPKKHLGYFVLLDTEGHPIMLANRRDIYNDLSTQNNGTASSTQGASQMIQMAQNLSLGVNPTGPYDPRQMVRIYGQLLEHDLKARLNAGVYGRNVNLKLTEDVYATMMARSFKRQQTQILYIPAELMVYVAFDYDERGFGRSLTEKGKIIGSMRAMLTFSQLMGAIKNSVSRQRITVQLSDNDIDPSKTLARVMDEFTRRRNVTMPFVASDPADMISYLNMAGVEWNVEGKGAPAHKVDIEDKQSNRAQINAELDTMLRDRHYQNYLVTPETVQASTGADFAASVVMNNQLMAKRVINTQDDFTPFLADIVKKISSNSAIIMNGLRETVRNALKMLKREADASKQVVADAAADAANPAAGTPLETEDTQPVDQVPGGQGLPMAPETNATKPFLPKTTDELPNYPIRQLQRPLVRETRDPTPAIPPMTEDQEAAYIEQIVMDFLDAVEVHLPRPDTTALETQTKEYDTYKDALTKRLDAMLDTQTFTDANLGVYAGRVDEIKNAYMNHYLRQWSQNNGFLTEVDEITSVDENGEPEFDLLQAVSSHANLIAASIQSYLDKVGQLKETIKEGTDVLTAKYPDAGLDQGGMGGGGGFGGDQGGFGNDTSGGMGGELGGGGPEGSGMGEELGLGGPMGEGSGANGELSMGGEEGAEEGPILGAEDEEEEEEEGKPEEGEEPTL